MRQYCLAGFLHRRGGWSVCLKRGAGREQAGHRHCWGLVLALAGSLGTGPLPLGTGDALGRGMTQNSFPSPSSCCSSTVTCCQLSPFCVTFLPLRFHLSFDFFTPFSFTVAADIYLLLFASTCFFPSSPFTVTFQCSDLSYGLSLKKPTCAQNHLKSPEKKCKALAAPAALPRQSLGGRSCTPDTQVVPSER